ncbi:hypothetical protein RB623_26630 [Mesorhizobium sp. LHD-90]|uniref:hypothetical protein n=1 Tax=Mesorhizobium sp. LHD-90 TaxID=3071414 RepID=UPI0027DFCC0A|nr:hypothetical protein [Mesorhizobium sp. LHD-90]MDQ6437643.1 hypothetical protein [Mesorhizobium sp. LHD-90]
MALYFPASSAETAETPQPKQMQFVVVRANDSACEPTCPEWISAEGAIGVKTPALLKAALRTLRGRKLPIVLFSAGGDVGAAMEMGRRIRRAGLPVVVGRTWFVGCRPDEKDCKANDGKGADFFGRALSSGGYCASECTLLLAGGVKRLVPDMAILRVRLRDPKMGKAVERRLAAYLKEMGVDRVVLDRMKSARGDNLDTGPLQAAGLVTGTGTAESVTESSICRTFPAPDNCRVFTVLDLED